MHWFNSVMVKEPPESMAVWETVTVLVQVGGSISGGIEKPFAEAPEGCCSSRMAGKGKHNNFLFCPTNFFTTRPAGRLVEKARAGSSMLTYQGGGREWRKTNQQRWSFK